MILRLLLALILILPAGLSAGQHQRCEPAATATAIDGAAAQHHASGEGHHASHEAGVNMHAAAAPADDCDGCDLACKVTCAAVALPLANQPATSAPRAATVSGMVVAGLLNPHPFPLLRPPAQTPA